MIQCEVVVAEKEKRDLILQESMFLQIVIITNYIRDASVGICQIKNYKILKFFLCLFSI